MSAEQFQRFLLASFASYRAVVKPGASMYVCHSSSWQREFQNALETAGFEVRVQIIWAKNTFAWGFGRYKFQHEPIFYLHVAGQKDPWYGDKSQSTLWAEKKPAANRIHPTAKPVELVERAIANSSKAGDIVLDLFGGSGSTLIACERRDRSARLMELDPKYVDVIVRRWQQYTGRKPSSKAMAAHSARLRKSAEWPHDSLAAAGRLRKSSSSFDPDTRISKGCVSRWRIGRENCEFCSQNEKSRRERIRRRKGWNCWRATA